MINMDELSKPEQMLIRAFAKRQIYIESKADVEYMCYWLKIDFVEFWRRFLGMAFLKLNYENE